MDVTGSKSNLTFEALPVDDPTRRCPDITRARTLLGWESHVNLRMGLAKSLDFFKSKLLEHVGQSGLVIRDSTPFPGTTVL